MNIPIIAKGFVIGLLLSLPVGPIAILCIRRSLTRGRLYGIFSGLGSATADALYGYIAAFGLSFVDTFLMEHQAALRILAGLFLCYLGLHIYLSNTPEKSTAGSTAGLLTTYFSTFFITLSNPMILVAFAVILATFGIEETVSKTAGTLLITGIFLGSATWWFTLSNIAHYLRTKITIAVLERINKLSGLIIIVFGILTLLSVIKPDLIPFVL